MVTKGSVNDPLPEKLPHSKPVLPSHVGAMAIEAATDGRGSSANLANVSFHECDRQQRVDRVVERPLPARGCKAAHTASRPPR